MKHFFLFIAISSIANYCMCMETFLRKLAGEHVTTRVITTNPQEQEPPFQIAHNFDEDIFLQATYACKVQFFYAPLRTVSCSTMHSFEGVTDRNDVPVKCKRNQTVKLIPVLDTLTKSRLRLTALKFCLVSKPNIWISVPSSTLAAAAEKSQFLHLNSIKK